MLPGTMLVCCLLAGLIMGTGNPILAQVPGRAATPPGPVGASMAVLAMLQDADVLPPEETPEANRIIKLVIQFQSVFMKSVADFDSLVGLVSKARTAFEQRGENLYQAFAQRRREMPGGTQ